MLTSLRNTETELLYLAFLTEPSFQYSSLSLKTNYMSCTTNVGHFRAADSWWSCWHFIFYFLLYLGKTFKQLLKFNKSVLCYKVWENLQVCFSNYKFQFSKIVKILVLYALVNIKLEDENSDLSPILIFLFLIGQKDNFTV